MSRFLGRGGPEGKSFAKAEGGAMRAIGRFVSGALLLTGAMALQLPAAHVESWVRWSTAWLTRGTAPGPKP